LKKLKNLDSDSEGDNGDEDDEGNGDAVPITVDNVDAVVAALTELPGTDVLDDEISSDKHTTQFPDTFNADDIIPDELKCLQGITVDDVWNAKFEAVLRYGAEREAAAAAQIIASGGSTFHAKPSLG
jgi:hypothetical protein